MFNEQIIESLDHKIKQLQQILDFQEYLCHLANPQSNIRALALSCLFLKQTLNEIYELKKNLQEHTIEF